MAISLLPPPPVLALARDPAAEVRGVTGRPLLTISVPTYQRVDLLERCLASIVPAEASTAGMIELVVSDNSSDSDAEEFVERFASLWQSPVRYYRNPPGTGAVRNFNHCIERARGLYNLILHDDDYLLPGAIDGIVHTLQVVDQARDKVLLFGVDVVDLSGNVIRHQRFPQDQFLDPQAALRRLLGNSSFVRLPGLVVQSATYQGIGGFRVSAHTTCDVDIEIRLFSQFGVRCLQQVAAAYTIHPGGITTTGFTPRAIALSLQNFDTARRTGVLDPAAVDRLQRHWFHQFILAGTWRALKERDWITARRVYALFDLPEIRAQGISGRWLPVRAAFAVLSGALWRRGFRLSTATNGSSDRTGSTAAAQPDANAKGRHGTGTALTREW